MTSADDVWSGPVRSFAMVIEPSVVAAFARSIGCVDERSVPPTFAVLADRFDPDFPRRPPLGRGWVDGPPETMLHVEQWFESHRPLTIGQRVEVRRGPGRRWQRAGRSGRLEFLEERTELRAEDGTLLVAAGWVDVRAEAAHRDLTTAQRSGEEDRSIVAVRDGEVEVASDLSVTQFVMYVGAAGDLHPLHHDVAMARALGYRDVFAPGMLTMALTLRGVTEVRELPDRHRVSSRFRAQVWPGDSLWVEVTEDGGVVRARTRDQFDTTVLETVIVEIAPD